MNIAKRIKRNWKSGLTVSLISMPLSISLAVASGSTPSIGIITAIWAGIVASIFGGSNFNVVGPTGALSGLIATYVMAHGTESLPILTVIVGVFVLVAYLFQLERYLILIPSSVINGFTLGIALIIGFGQFNAAFGLSGLPKHETFFMNLIESFKHLPQASPSTFAVFAIFLIALFVLRRLIPRIPSALILSPFAILIGYLGTVGIIPLHLTTLGSAFKDISFKLFETPHVVVSPTLFVTGAAIALVAIIETMLSAKIADGMTHTKHNERREMLGLGLANIASGIAGGIPATAALARTSLNIKTGAKDNSSAMMSSVFLCIISFFLLAYFKYIPMAVIGSILAYVAIEMIEMDNFAKFYRYQKSGFWLSLLVAAITVYEDPIVGIIFGTALALLLFVEKISHGQFDLKLNTFEDGLIQTITGDKLDEIEESADILLYSIKGSLFYINSRSHTVRFEENLSDYKVIILRLRSAYFMDLDGAEALDEIIGIIQKRHQTVCVTSINDNLDCLMKQVSARYRKLSDEGLVFTKSEDALTFFGLEPEKLVNA